jgi:hypothetical protein
VTNRYVSLLPDARVRDFAGPYAYHWALGIFLGVSLIFYYLSCLISPEIVKGGAKLLGSDVDVDKIAEGIPIPLYIAALFTGLTQPIVPGLSQFQTAQLAFFHDQIAVPRRIIDVSESLTVAIEARAGQDRQRLLAEVRKLVGTDFLASLQPHGDLAFYKIQLEKLGVDSGALEATLEGSSVKELRALIERLVLCALVAVSRKSGSKPLAKVAQKLEIQMADVKRDRGSRIIGLVFSSLLFLAGLLIIAELLVFLAAPVSALFGKSPVNGLWPSTLDYAFQELWRIALPIGVCMLLVVSRAVPSEAGSDPDNADDASLFDCFLDFVRSNASVLLVCILTAVAIKIGLMFWEYGTFNLPPEARSPLRLTLPALQSFVTLAVCAFTMWYLVSTARGGVSRGPSFMATVMLVAASTGLLALLYDVAFLEQYLKAHPDAGSGGEHYLFSVMANTLVAIAAFVSVVVFAKAGKIKPSRSRMDARGATLNPGGSVRPVQAPPLVPLAPIAVAQEPRARLGT